MEKTKLLILRITDRCNLACKYCYAACDKGKESDMTAEIAMEAIHLFAKSGDKLKIQFTGGEPLLCMDLIETIFQYVKQEGIQTSFSIQTNGTLLTERACGLLKKMRCGVGVSLDGIAEANGLRVYPDGSLAFAQILEGIHMLARFSMGCNLNAVVTSVNQGALGELVELAGLCGNVYGIGLDMFRPMGRGKDKDFAPDIRSLEEDIKRMLKKRQELDLLGVNVRMKELEKVRWMLQRGIHEDCYCYAGTGLSAAVSPSGEFYPCASFVGRKEFCIGNVAEGISFLPQPFAMEKQCKDCPDVAICRGGCPAGRVACGGINESDCRMHRTIIQYGRMEYDETAVLD